MNQYHSVEEYINEVQKHIRWKRARNIATLDLKQHIQDQFDVYTSKGMETNLALEKSIRSMGNPETIGKELDCAYRPKINIILIELTIAFLLLGLVINYLLEGQFSKNSFIAIAIGSSLAVALYFFDYTVLLRHPLAIYIMHLFISTSIFAFEARNGLNCIGYNYTFYTLLLFPISLSVIALFLKERNKRYGLFLFTTFAVPPLILSFLISSVPTITIILTIYAVIVFWGIKRNWFIISIPCVSMTVTIIISILIIIYFLFSFLNLKTPSLISYDSFFQQKIIDSVNATGFYGTGDYQIESTMERLLLEKYPFILLLQKYGYLGVGCISVIFIGLLLVMANVARKQKTEIGKITAWITLFIISFQLLGSIICNFKYFGEMNISIPFLANGGVFTIIDLFLIGIILSVSRHEDIVKEWIKQKSRRREHNV